MTHSRFRVLASNLHVGGGVQVAASLLDEAALLTSDPDWSELLGATHFEVSPSIVRNVAPATLGKLLHDVQYRRPGAPSHVVRDLLEPCEAALTVFGPLYSLPRCARRIMSYADVTSIYPDPAGSSGTRSWLRTQLSRLELRAQHSVIVETAAMQSRIVQILGRHAPALRVVPNAVSGRVLSAAHDDVVAAQIAVPRQSHDLVLAYPTRDYPHKNLEFLPDVAAEMSELGVRVNFIVTLRPDEWDRRSVRFRAVCTNLGEVTVDQIATLLRASDGLFFPSLLEAYSASPVEAMALGVPVFASDRDFVRTVCGDAAVYLNPQDASRAASVVVETRSHPDDQKMRVEAGLRRASDAPTARDRALALLSILYGLPDVGAA